MKFEHTTSFIYPIQAPLLLLLPFRWVFLFDFIKNVEIHSNSLKPTLSLLQMMSLAAQPKKLTHKQNGQNMLQCFWNQFAYASIIEIIKQTMKKLLMFFLALNMLQFVSAVRYDARCTTVRCAANYRCEDGFCLKQNYSPKKSICSPSDEIRAIRCTNRNYKCLNPPDLLSCGYAKDGSRYDFPNDCAPCLLKEIEFYYRLSCTQSPPICLETEECVNSKCVALFNRSEHKDYLVCNDSSQCRRFIEICVANKCVSIREAADELKKNVK